MTEHKEIQNNDMTAKEIPKSCNSETIFVLVLLCSIWMAMFISQSEAGGYVEAILIGFGFLSSAIGSLILFFPLRKLVRLGLYGEKKILPRIVIISIFGALITFVTVNFTPVYIKEMKSAANEYYIDHSQEFDNPVEGKTINIRVISGPYITYFVFTKVKAPNQPKGGIVIDYKNGWYFVLAFYPI